MPASKTTDPFAGSAIDPARSSSSGVGVTVVQQHHDALSMFRAAVDEFADHTMVAYFDGELTFAQVDAESDAIASALVADGVAVGDRVAVVAQNIPHFLVALVGIWKAGAVIVPVNPMVGDAELRHMLSDSGAVVVFCEETRIGSQAWLEGIDLTAPVISMCPRDYQHRDDERVLPPCPGTITGRDFAGIVASFAGRTPKAYTPDGDSPAALTYTSGTTGRPKGAVNRHRNLAFAGQVYRDWLPLSEHDAILGVPPMSTITGLAIGVAATLLTGCRYVINYRFAPGVLVDIIREHRPTFLVGPPTLYTALLNDPELTASDTASLTHLYCGAAPVPPVLVERWRKRFGQEIRVAYGMTEATGPTHLAPVGVPIPVDEITGALSVGVAVFSTRARVVRPDGTVDDEVGDGEPGELIVSGPQVIREYWRNSEGTRQTIVDGWLRTGDMAVRHGDWFFIVDRLKDLIITSGNNVSPRQVEDCLLGHAAVREVAVIGVPDDYRGEAVCAFVVTDPTAVVTELELIGHCRDRLAPYKAPRRIEFVDELPKNIAGKILRRVLKDRVVAHESC
ncbi:class I adenylate-forming enzyme family protein [Gordonia rhizosphera]|uniref:Putative fatty-acid--CoA ligase n=1 Tax=Gordonia rhizosphera NBRC 16068 TaxID=1108045 RepID=K6WJP9_9ACTN|nr:AMP-binding protein [Gordonia rhizosphera]GAB92362.1 putative fatty-acid--CoA ligase [Gordonia rhizosphera NBRC 16068]